MNNDLIKEHINILIKDLKANDCKFSVDILTRSIKAAILNDDFFKIDYEKYTKTIIDNSNISLNQKESLHQVFMRRKLKIVINCKSCGKPIEGIITYYLEYPYHAKCVKCMNKNCKKSNDINHMICVTPGLFLCQEHYKQYKETKQLSPEISEEYHKKNKENFVKQLFANPLKNINIVDGQSSDPLITPDVIQDSIPIKRPFEYFIPTIKYQFDKNPSEIDFDKLRQKLGDEVLIISAIVGNIEKEEITLPDEQKMQEYYDKGSLNLLQSTQKLEKTDYENFKKKILEEAEEISQKNFNFVFKHEYIYLNVDKQIRDDIRMNDFEMILVGQTIIANRYINEFNQLKETIPNESRRVVFLYHGTKLENHQSIIEKNFLVPRGNDEKEWEYQKNDVGYFGKGIYATDNIFYAAKYSYSINKDIAFNEKVHVICCMAVFNDKKAKSITDKSYKGEDISEDVVNSCGMHHALVGSSKEFWPIKEGEEDYNYITANEFVFPNKYQIIPVYSFTVMRKDHFILWKDENIENSENTNYMKELQERMEVNVYFSKSVDEALEIIKRKKKNKIKLITNGGINLTGKKLIEEARKIIGSNFVCFVFASSRNHIKWVSKMENVLFTTSECDFKEFAAMNLDKDNIIKFARKLEGKYDYKIKINEDELLNFPTNLKSKYRYTNEKK
ncbi:hypothetical protein M9Y10_031466 [Tritrichomonas musculus]|uniref:PARP catalytic domain-containing protein n=1 Tax=Tritrichomonas musculus TaxID=1915356 RepID=A0ABR2H1I1_9EUKA